MEEVIEKLGMGWLPDYTDFRDYTVEEEDVPAKLQAFGQKGGDNLCQYIAEKKIAIRCTGVKIALTGLLQTTRKELKSLNTVSFAMNAKQKKMLELAVNNYLFCSSFY